MLAQVELEIVIMANLSDKFQEAMSGSGLLVKSVFEMKNTHIGDKLFMGRKQLVSNIFSAVPSIVKLRNASCG